MKILSRISSYRSVLFTWLSDKNLLCYSAAGLAAPASVFPVPPASGPSLHLTSVSPLPPALEYSMEHVCTARFEFSPDIAVGSFN